ncbi:MAG TPA: hypothetical protein PK360_16595, partial [bacterium]|nr:hypothetical protein [bacterium]
MPPIPFTPLKNNPSLSGYKRWIKNSPLHEKSIKQEPEKEGYPRKKSVRNHRHLRTKTYADRFSLLSGTFRLSIYIVTQNGRFNSYSEPFDPYMVVLAGTGTEDCHLRLFKFKSYGIGGRQDACTTNSLTPGPSPTRGEGRQAGKMPVP